MMIDLISKEYNTPLKLRKLEQLATLEAVIKNAANLLPRPIVDSNAVYYGDCLQLLRGIDAARGDEPRKWSEPL